MRPGIVRIGRPLRHLSRWSVAITRGARGESTIVGWGDDLREAIARFRAVAHLELVFVSSRPLPPGEA